VIIAADVAATRQAFEMLLGRPIGADEIEARNVYYRMTGQPAVTLPLHWTPVHA
jgi:hypothetical protein